MDQTNLFFRFGVALFIGILVGLQREFAFHKEDKELPAGVRTFALMSLVGASGAFISDILNSPWPFVGIFLSISFVVMGNYFIQAWRGDIGLTTEAAAILTTLAGALVYWEYIQIGVALAVVTTTLLSLKLELHTFARHLTQADIISTLKFAVITAIVLPILPNKSYGPEPFNLFNPYTIWLLVVLISAISFTGYVLIKIAGPRKGIGLTGILGGLVSSTAVTLNFTQQSRTHQELSRPFAMAILLAWSIMFPRMLIIVAALNGELAQRLLVPLMVLVFIGLVYCAYLYYSARVTPQTKQVTFVNPFELGPAIKFGLLFSVILLISKAAKIYFGDAGLYLASLLSGLADVDAITLSVARLTQGVAPLSLATAMRAVLIAATANTVVKGGVVLISGSAQLRRAILPGFALITLAAVGFVIFY